MTIKLYGTKEAAEYLGISVEGVRSRLDAGTLHQFARVANRILFTQAELDQSIKDTPSKGQPPKYRARKNKKGAS